MVHEVPEGRQHGGLDVISSPLKYHGGKSYLASKIVAMFPRTYTHYVEPYAGGLSVLLAAEPEGHSEVVNDISQELTSFWIVLQRDDLFEIFKRQVEAVPFSETQFQISETPKQEFLLNHVDMAVCFFVRCRQSLAGRMKDFATLSRTRTRRGMNEQASAWLTAIEGLPEVHARLKRVVILNRDALDVIRTQDGEQTLFYLDPPYLHSTRESTEVYQHEMREFDHLNLLHFLADIKGKFLLSGYNSALYNTFGEDFKWCRTEFDLPNNAAGGDTKRRMKEVIWSNFTPGT